MDHDTVVTIISTEILKRRGTRSNKNRPPPPKKKKKKNVPVAKGVHDVLEALGVQRPPPREIERLPSIALRVSEEGRVPIR